MGISKHAVRVAVFALAAGFAVPAPADDPRDPAMTPEAIARDAATIRRLNREQLDYVRRRDSGYAQGWRDYDAAQGRRTIDDGDDDARDYDARADYAEARRRYEREMREWREDVAACRAGYYEHCAR